MRIGIIGAGMIGGTFAKRFVELGHDVAIANSRGPETLAEVASQTGAEALEARKAAQGRDVVVVTIQEGRIPELPDDHLAEVGSETAVVDTCNYYPRERDGRIEAIEEGLTESRWVEAQIGHPVVKAFNNIYFLHLGEKGQPAGSPGRIALPVAGDDEAAKKRVMGPIEELGFGAIDAGDSWRQQPGTPVHTADLDADGVRRALGEASPERPESMRATDRSPGSFEEPR